LNAVLRIKKKNGLKNAQSGAESIKAATWKSQNTRLKPK
jgi:hypothetical protein